MTELKTDTVSTKQVEEKKAPEGHDLTQKLNVTGWALFFIWIGVAFMVKFDTAVSLFGIGVITLRMQAFRKYSNLKLESFWVVVGLLFVVGGIWGIFKVDFSLAPIVLIVAGLVLLVSMLRGKSPVKK